VEEAMRHITRRIYDQNPDEIERERGLMLIGEWLEARKTLELRPPDSAAKDASVICPTCRLPFVADRMCSGTNYQEHCLEIRIVS